MSARGNVGAGRPSGGCMKVIFGLAVVIGIFGVGGYFAWSHHKEIGEAVGMDPEKTEELAERAKDLAATAGEKAREGAARAREVLGERKTDLEAWFKERDIEIPSREDLVAIAEKYKSRFAGNGASPAGDVDEATERDETGTGKKEPVEVASRPPQPEGERRRRPTARGRRETPAPPAPAPGGEAPAESDPLELGNAEFKRGFALWKAAPVGSPDEQEKLRQAREHFSAARDHFAEVRKARPDDAEIEELLTDCNRFLYDCMKRTVLDVYK